MVTNFERVFTVDYEMFVVHAVASTCVCVLNEYVVSINASNNNWICDVEWIQDVCVRFVSFVVVFQQIEVCESVETYDRIYSEFVVISNVCTIAVEIGRDSVATHVQFSSSIRHIVIIVARA